MIGCDPFDENMNGCSCDLFDGLVDILDDIPMRNTDGEDWGAGLQSPPDDLVGLSSLLCVNTSNDGPRLLPNFPVPIDKTSQPKGQPSTIEENCNKTIPFCNDNTDSQLSQTSSPVSVLECSSSSSVKKVMSFIPEIVIPAKRARSKRARPLTSKQPLDPLKDSSSKRSSLNRDSYNSKKEELIKNPSPVSALESSSSCSVENSTPSGPKITLSVKHSHSKQLRPSTSNQQLNPTKNTSCESTPLHIENSDLFKTSNPVSILCSSSSCSVEKPLPFVPEILIALKNSKSNFPLPSTVTWAKYPSNKVPCSSTEAPVKRLRSKRPHPSTIISEKHSCNNYPNPSTIISEKHSYNNNSNPSTTFPLKRSGNKRQQPSTTLPVERPKSNHQDPSTILSHVPINSSSSAFQAINPLAASEEMQIQHPKKLNSMERKQKNRKRKKLSMLSNATEDKKNSFQQPVATRKCMQCGVTMTSLWRKGPMGPKTLCNACWCKHKYNCTFPTGNTTIATILASIKSNPRKKIAEFSNKDGKETATATNPPFLASLPINSLETGVDMRNKAGEDASISPFVASPQSNSSKKVTEIGKKASQEVAMMASCSIAAALPANPHRNKSLQQAVEVKKCSHCEETKTCRWREKPMGPNTLCNGCWHLYKHGRLLSFMKSTPLVASPQSNSSKKVTEIGKKAGQEVALMASCRIAAALPANPHRKKSLQQAVEVKKCTHCEETKACRWREEPMGPNTLCNGCWHLYKHGRLLSFMKSTPHVASLRSSSRKKVLEMKKKAGQDTALAGSPILCTSLCKISQKKESLKQPIDAQKCMHCEATRTPKWRNGPKGPHTLCNACGLRYQKAFRKM